MVTDDENSRHYSLNNDLAAAGDVSDELYEAVDAVVDLVETKEAVRVNEAHVNISDYRAIGLELITDAFEGDDRRDLDKGGFHACITEDPFEKENWVILYWPNWEVEGPTQAFRRFQNALSERSKRGREYGLELDFS